MRSVLPPTVLDFHAHVWSKSNWRRVPYEDGSPSGRYMVMETEYPVERLAADARRILPDNAYRTVCFRSWPWRTRRRSGSRYPRGAPGYCWPPWAPGPTAWLPCSGC